MSLIHMTVKALRETAKANGLTGYSRLNKSDLVELIASNTTAHKVGDVVRNIHNNRVGTVTYTNDAAVIVTCEDGGPKMSGEHYEFTYTGVVSKNHAHSEAIEMDEKRSIVRASLSIPSGVVLNWTQIEQAYAAYVTGREEKKMDRYSHWAMDHRCIRGGDWDVRQGHADYCAEFGHATYTVDGVVMSWCPRCGETIKNPEQVISERDTIDQRQMVDVMTQVVDNGREDLIPVLDKIDAAQCQVPDGRDSSIPRVHFCPRCADSTNPCDQCVLTWLVALFNITGDVTLAKLPHVVEFDCYA